MAPSGWGITSKRSSELRRSHWWLPSARLVSPRRRRRSSLFRPWTLASVRWEVARCGASCTDSGNAYLTRIPGSTSMDLSGFTAQFPDLAAEDAMRAHGAHVAPSGARELDLSGDALDGFTVSAPKDPNTLAAILKSGPEAVASYVSFRTEPRR